MFRANEIHHAYLGALMVMVGALVGAAWCFWLGLCLILDDAAQHFLGIPSPAKWLYGKTLWRIAAVRRLNRWLDRVLA